MTSDPLFIFPSDSLPKPEIHVGNCLDILRIFPDRSIDSCVTSPPYFGLRDYNTGENQIGLEKTPAAYVENLVAVFAEVHRVLKDHGSLWLNLGDSYVANGGSHKDRLDNQVNVGSKRVHLAGAADGYRFRPPSSGILKPKDLLGMPWRVAFALQDAGWFLRSDIIWHKPNCLPESVQDRPTSSHEHVFLLTKSPYYYYDAVAIAEPVAAETAARYAYDFGGAKNESLRENTTNRTRMLGQKVAPTTRNSRNVWSIPVRPYRDAHFATMPPELAQKCVLAGSSEKGCCPACGKPWRRVQPSWEPSCGCSLAEPIPSRVLDPFGGAGTTGLVAQRLGRCGVLIELNPAYADLARERIDRDKSQM